MISTRKLTQSPKKATSKINTRAVSGIPVPCTSPVRARKPSPEGVLIVGQSTLSFHERASSKDVIDELNRMIRKGEEPPAVDASEPLDEQCAQPTGWVHVEREIDFTDPKVFFFCILICVEKC